MKKKITYARQASIRGNQLLLSNFQISITVMMSKIPYKWIYEGLKEKDIIEDWESGLTPEKGRFLMLAVLFEVTERLITWLKERVKARNNISDIPIQRNVLQCSRLAKVTLEWTSIHVTYRKHRIQIIVMKTIPWNIRNGLRVHEKLDEHKANEAKRFINFQF